VPATAERRERGGGKRGAGARDPSRLGEPPFQPPRRKPLSANRILTAASRRPRTTAVSTRIMLAVLDQSERDRALRPFFVVVSN
jgi:hypothetical protein